jgi:hypothetical protein
VVQIFDGSSPPQRLNPETKLTTLSGTPFITYDPDKDMLVISGSSAADKDLFYHFATQRWGNGPALLATNVPVVGDGTARVTHYESDTTTRPDKWHVLSGSWDKYPALQASEIDGTSSVQSGLYGSADQKTQFSRVTPILSLRAPAETAALTWTAVRERHDTGSGSSGSASESSQRKRFDFNVVDNFGYFQVTFTDNRVAISDIAVTMKPAGRE